MRGLESREPVPLRQASVRETNDLDEWQASVNRRNEVYASTLAKAMEGRKSSEEARLMARQAFMATFDDRPETEYMVSLGGIEVAPIRRRGRRAA